MNRPKKKLSVSGWPAAEDQTEDMLKSLRSRIKRGGKNAFVQFHSDFLPALDLFLDQLIDWTENGSGELHDWAGRALAERLRFLSAQEGHWRSNRAFEETEIAFGDRRQARTPTGYLGWLTGDYVRLIERERRYAGLQLQVRRSKAKKVWLEAVKGLSDLSPESVDEWITVVYQRMRQDRKRILALCRKSTYPSRQFRENPQEVGAFRFSDLRPTIAKAVRALAAKPSGQVRGVTKP